MKKMNRTFDDLLIDVRPFSRIFIAVLLGLAVLAAVLGAWLVVAINLTTAVVFVGLRRSVYRSIRPKD
jgi:Na+/H+ antiporter NhaB